MIDRKLIGQYKSYLKDNLSKKRYSHSINVATAALKLARNYGVDEDKAYMAGLLHDICKELPMEKQYEYVMLSHLNVSEIETHTTALFHAIAGAEFVQQEFGIYDLDILKAMRYHTVACKDMSRLSQVIYLADIISDDRDYKEVKKMRKFTEQSLERAMYEALKFSISDSLLKENTIPISTLEAYNDFVKFVNDK